MMPNKENPLHPRPPKWNVENEACLHMESSSVVTFHLRDANSSLHKQTKTSFEFAGWDADSDITAEIRAQFGQLPSLAALWLSFKKVQEAKERINADYLTGY